MIRGAMLFAAAALVAAPAPTQAPPTAAPDYARPASWLCLPGRADICSRPLPTTVLNAGGFGATGPSMVAKDPPVDCFYVYPTVSNDDSLNSDMIADNSERFAAMTQFARFAGVCRTFAPIYRQMTVGAIAAAATGADVAGPAKIAYGDVAAAWRNYLARYNQGRPFVLIGHSQGSAMLEELIVREIEGKSVARRMLRAIIPGYNVLVPVGRRVGGTFKSTPLCAAPAETGCVMSWTSYRERNAPPEGALFGYSSEAGMTVGCTNPASPGSTRWERLDSYWNTHSSAEVPGGPIRWSSAGDPPSPNLDTPGLISGRCVNDGPRGYLSLRTNHAPGDKRTDRIGGEVGMFGFFLPGWGMHLADLNAAQGDLIRAIGELSARPRTAPRPVR